MLWENLRMKSSLFYNLVYDVNTEQLQALLKEDPHFADTPDERGSTLLHHAATIGSGIFSNKNKEQITTFLSVLLKAPGNCLSVKDASGNTPLHIVMRRPDSKFTKIILPLFIQAAVDLDFDFSTLDSSGRTVLQVAVQAVDSDVKIEKLWEIAKKASTFDVNTLSGLGVTAFFYAIERSNYIAAHMLLKIGADPTKQVPLALDIHEKWKYVEGGNWVTYFPPGFSSTDPIPLLEQHFLEVTQNLHASSSRKERAELQEYLDILVNPLRQDPRINTYRDPIQAEYYELDLHRHYKIWLSKEKDLFLNIENQLRLITMRKHNPNDIIHLVYSKQLLSDAAQKQLDLFCKKHTIVPISVEEDIIPACSTQESEQNLIRIYTQEIQAVQQNEGGNLASASDILRWLSPVYRLGIYADFDVAISTKQCGDVISIPKPILLNIGSLCIDGAPKKIEFIILNNDVLAILGNDAVTQKLVQQIQEQIFLAHQGKAQYTDFDQRCIHNLAQFGLPAITISGQNEYRVESILNSMHGDAISLRNQLATDEKQHYEDLHSYAISLLDSAIKEYCSKVASTFNAPEDERIAQETKQRQEIRAISEEECKEAAADLLLMQALEPDQPESLYPILERAKQESNDSVLKAWLRVNYFLPAYKATVTCTTGPMRLACALFSAAILPETEIDILVAPYSFKHYIPLWPLFKSTNALALHSKRSEITQQLTGGDLSWVEEGAKKVTAREKRYDQAARTLQGFFRKIRLSETSLQKQVETDKKRSSFD